MTGVSEPLNFEIAAVVRPLPTIELLPLSSATATVGSRVILQAVSNGSITPVARIDFYANGVLIGSRGVNDPADGSNTTTLFEWTPNVSGNFVLSARAIQVLAETGDNSVISEGQSISVGNSSGFSPVVIISPQPIAEGRYVIGSEVFLNATAVARGGATIPTNGVSFYFSGLTQVATASAIFTGSQQFYSSRASLEEEGDKIFFATARDSSNSVGSSSTFPIEVVRPLFPLPQVEMLELLYPEDGGAVPGAPVRLQARAIFPPSAATDARVEFYANGAYLGAGAPGSPTATNGLTDPQVYTFDWQIPDRPGNFKIEARAL
ncbi:MAG: hypothetical protein JHC85_09420, partial [Chthoniobacterales bacterium]|nr:hypothetical protein [Chthoniobacterales bacterium]